jgi:hypothetical protein
VSRSVSSTCRLDQGCSHDGNCFEWCSIEVANYLSWFLLVEIEDDKHGGMFARVYAGMTQALERFVGFCDLCTLCSPEAIAAFSVSDERASVGKAGTSWTR